ncbi:hypothetical protein [Nannocystis punicea]|uniref:Meckel syndrome type 1 protein n=1 Tax=Nannocystis punicea TaxID=2995304 RepID=A0ABY7GVP7_9BACT|nr:hypothetical protein [Nannocystis poenicansa]WAS91038.1 hypothetical protein O0S08_33030 [Nannocystis poenicansa]
MTITDDSANRRTASAADLDAPLASAGVLLLARRSRAAAAPGPRRLACLPFLGLGRAARARRVTVEDPALAWASLPLASLLLWGLTPADGPRSPASAPTSPSGQVEAPLAGASLPLPLRHAEATSPPSRDVGAAPRWSAMQRPAPTPPAPTPPAPTAPALAPAPPATAAPAPAGAAAPRPPAPGPAASAGVVHTAPSEPRWALPVPAGSRPIAAARDLPASGSSPRVDHTWPLVPRPGAAALPATAAAPPAVASPAAIELPAPVPARAYDPASRAAAPPVAAPVAAPPRRSDRAPGGPAQLQPLPALPWAEGGTRVGRDGPALPGEPPLRPTLAGAPMELPQLLRAIDRVVERTVTERVARALAPSKPPPAPAPAPASAPAPEVFSEQGVRRLMVMMRRIEQYERLRGGELA